MHDRDPRAGTELGVPLLARFSALAVQALADDRAEIDALNVYPVPDGDTATGPADVPTPPEGAVEATAATPEPPTDGPSGTPPDVDGGGAETPVRAASSEDAGRRAPQAE